MKMWWNHDKQFMCPFIWKKMGIHENKIARYLQKLTKSLTFTKPEKNIILILLKLDENICVHLCLFVYMPFHNTKK